MSERLYETLGKIAKEKIDPNTFSEYMGGKIRTESNKILAKTLGVSFSSLERIFLGRGKSKPFTKEEIAQRLLSNNLVKNNEEALQETEILLKNGFCNEYIIPGGTNYNTFNPVKMTNKDKKELYKFVFSSVDVTFGSGY